MRCISCGDGENLPSDGHCRACRLVRVTVSVHAPLAPREEIFEDVLRAVSLDSGIPVEILREEMRKRDKKT